MRILVGALALVVAALIADGALQAGATPIDVIVGLEVAVLVLLGVPLSLRGTVRLLDAVRVSTVNDRLARAITGYVTLVQLSAIYLLSLTTYRVLTGIPAPDWLRPITAGILSLVMVGPWWIERAVGVPGRIRRDRTPKMGAHEEENTP